MVSFSRRSKFLLATSATLFLASCGADDVASPGAGSLPITIVQPAPTPTPTAAPTPTALTNAQIALATAQNGITVTADEQVAILNAGQNNNLQGFGSTLNGVYPVSGTSLATASNPQTVLGNSSFIQNTSFVGALSGPNDSAFSGWTCSSTAASFLNSGNCSAAPSIGTGGATATCPTGTIDDGLVQTFRACRLPSGTETPQILSDLTLPKISGVFYRLRGQTEIGNGTASVTLTIAPGVVIAADSSESSNDLLLVNRGSRLNAVGTADAPIIFTAQQNLASNGVSDATQGLWGGVVLLGRAPTAVCAAGTGPNDANGSSATCQQAIEGVTGRFYGGSDQADSSGTLQYVQIRFTGIAISEGNELQGLTLGGTGSGTTIDHVQSHNSSDDGVEIFGGATNLKYFVVTGADDDGFDVDNGWRGFMQFIIAAQKASGSTADSFATEIDSNNAEDLLPRTYGRYANFTFVQTNSAPAAIRLRGGADFAFVNGVVKSAAGAACVNIIAGAGDGATRTTIRAADSALQDVGPPTFNSVYFQCQGR
ncbi:hypothetical protein K7957_01105 [Sphingomonas yunnanensis]|uniref:hypothetical protein n=1 Tax=Sphingomonas yunnanensis TaxID=310400 RepID=UPI001CA75CF3|nr:hypothetical protein [Sphingomonas yunnanensis]MBY9061529.1 hypothetical protein [Sphingomonas yunnanensis]